MAAEPGHWSVAVVGAGPAGLFAARELCNHGVDVTLFNRDIKPGGLAEYGIYPDKLKMKDGLRAQIKQILNCGNIHYYGNVTVGENQPLTLEKLKEWGFSAIVVTIGAQGTKWLGLPGERIPGVYHAKEVVYYYNHLPPFSQSPIKIGKKVAIIGVGNVMADVSHYLIHMRKVDEVYAIARRGPAETKFDRKEMESFSSNLDLGDFEAEMKRVAPVMLSLGQDPSVPRQMIADAVGKGLPKDSDTKFRFRFLLSPVRIHGSNASGVEGLELEENTLVMDKDQVKARGLGRYFVLDVDTVIFAIGDRVDDHLGLPTTGSEYAKSDHPAFPVESTSYEVMDPATHENLPGLFVGGWSRNASSGVVGIARRDGVQCAASVMQYLTNGAAPSDIEAETVKSKLIELGYEPVEKPMLEPLLRAEETQAQRLGIPDFKFDSNEEMLAAIHEESAMQS